MAPRTSTLASRLPQPVQMVPLSLAAAGRLQACLFSCSLTRPGMRAPSKALGVNSQLQQADSKLPIPGWDPRHECCGQSQCPEARARMRPGGVGGGRLQGKSMCKGSAAGGSRASDLRDIQRLGLRFRVVGKDGGRRVRGNWRRMGSACEALANPVEGFALYPEVLRGGGHHGF